MPVFDVDVERVLEVFVERVEETVGDVGARACEVGGHDVGGDVAGDLHEGEQVVLGADDLEARRGDGPDVGVLLLEDFEDFEVSEERGPITGPFVDTHGRTKVHRLRRIRQFVSVEDGRQEYQNS